MLAFYEMLSLRVLGSVGLWFLHQNHTCPFSQDCKRETEKSKGWGAGPQAPRPPDSATPSRTSEKSGKTGWLRVRLPKTHPSSPGIHPKKSAWRHQHFLSFPRHFSHLNNNEIMPIFREKINSFWKLFCRSAQQLVGLIAFLSRWKLYRSVNERTLRL